MCVLSNENEAVWTLWTLSGAKLRCHFKMPRQLWEIPVTGNNFTDQSNKHLLTSSDQDVR